MVCQDPADPLDLLLGRRRREGQGERALEGAIGARERPLLPVGLESVQRPGADLRLDPGAAQGCDRLVTAVDLDDVGLPAVPVVPVGTRNEQDFLEALRVPRGNTLSRAEEILE